ncbi:DEAD/DEAH box helicase family protein [Vibrio sp. 99-8-1]|uniref:DEAD/DEAH box helicase family protein n=1 Tax=Vibrio sp. 99-8-1 TaxID=2607602 RepID=UPI0014938250|nr:DEAD/DEAH box helicase family protein [Vibrio sp. 99-8-1]NOI68338.1 DEAD/DEAH box helicase [Vibrio sp. 99-8-1]
MQELTYNRLIHHSFSKTYQSFKETYNQLFDTSEIEDHQRAKILAIVVLFSNQSDKLLNKLAYRMALAYGLKTFDYKPLYDIAINTGLIPVVALLKQVNAFSVDNGMQDSFISNLMDSYVDNFRVHNIVHTEQQVALNGFFSQHSQDSATVVAPTSYGKSELIMSAIEYAKNKNICVLVPSKSLLAQTRKRILDAKIEWVSRIISHPEMCSNSEEPSVYVLTQERLTRLLNQYKTLTFDMVIVDEAHNILDKDGRNGPCK